MTLLKKDENLKFESSIPSHAFFIQIMIIMIIIMIIMIVIITTIMIIKMILIMIITITIIFVYLPKNEKWQTMKRKSFKLSVYFLWVFPIITNIFFLH